MEEKENFTKNSDEEENKNKDEISTLKMALSSKNEIILNLQKELELNRIKNNLNHIQVLTNNNSNLNHTLMRYESFRNVRDNINSKNINSLSKKIV